MARTIIPGERNTMKCDCGRKVSVIRYVDNKRVCDNCQGRQLSGTFLRRMELEAKTYAKDILQPYNKDGSINLDYKEVYGEYKPSSKKKRDKEETV